jgi:hypothetical protein
VGVIHFSPKISHLVSNVSSNVKSASFFDNLDANNGGNGTAATAMVWQQQRPKMVEANRGRQRHKTTMAAYANDNSSRQQQGVA